MSRPQKIMKPIKAKSFNNILAAVAGRRPAARRPAVATADAESLSDQQYQLLKKKVESVFRVIGNKPAQGRKANDPQRRSP